MKLNRVIHFFAGLGLVIPSVGHSNVDLADRPLFIDGNVKPNIVFALDDSGSMDHELLFPAQDGSLFYDGDNGFFTDADGNYYQDTSSGRQWTSYIFPVGQNSTYDGRRIFADWVVPPVNAYAFSRSTQFNRNYYNPALDYRPWPSTATISYPEAETTVARFDPNYATPALNLVADQTADFAGFGEHSYYPAVFYVPVQSGAFTSGLNRYDCASTSSSDYRTIYAGDDKNVEFTDSGEVSALAPDGRCLVEVELRPDNETLIQSQTGRTYAEEIQNFANWFTYHRRRHQSLRGAVGESLRGLSGLYVDSLWVNGLSTIVPKDLETEGDDFFSDIYGHFDGWGGGGTGLRNTLNYAGSEFDRNKDVIVAECQKNYTLLFTDGFNNAEVSGVENADGNEGPPYADTSSNTLADVAMKFYKGPLRSTDPKFEDGRVRLADACYKKDGDPGFDPSNLTRSVPGDPSYDPSADCNSSLHMNTYTVGFGAEGANFVGKGYEKVADAYSIDPDAGPDWSLVKDTVWDENQVDDLYHAAVNGRGEFYNASNVDELRLSISKALRDIIRSTGSATNVTFNTATLEEGSNVFTASFNSGDWSGSVAARELNPVTGAIGSPVWDAADTLNELDPASRFIVTYQPGPDSGTGVLFEWDNLTVAQQDDLNGTTDDDQGPARLAYLRGSRSSEGTVFRTRSTVLGDVVNSSPVFAGRPASGWPDRDPFGEPDTLLGDGTFTNTGRYSGFRQNNADRTPMVYAGANDGMLHGFNAESGEELVAYVPGGVYSSEEEQGLNYLSDPSYEHRFYVDLSPAVSDVFIGDGNGFGPEWKSVLIGGLRAGGRGLFALDITDPANFSNTEDAAADLSMWEFTHPDLGFITEPPVVAMVKWGADDYRWSAIVSNGYGSDNGKTGLFVLDIESGQGGWDTNNARFIELVATAGSGLSPLRAVDYQDEGGVTAKDGIVDRVYAGDLEGNVWAVDLTEGVANWGSAYAETTGPSKSPLPFFIATDSAGNRQPITSAPVMSRNFYNTAADDPNLMVMFGTGQYLTETDPQSTATQSFYGVWDREEQVTRSDLVTRTIVQTVDQGFDIRTINGEGIDWTDPDLGGWFMDFDPAITGEAAGERVVSSPLVRGEFVLFNTITPSRDLCQSGGSSWTMAVRLDGTTPDRPVFDVNNDGSVDDDDGMVAGVRHGDALILNSNLLGDNLYSQGSDGEVDQRKVSLGGGKITGRSGWREIYQE